MFDSLPGSINATWDFVYLPVKKNRNDLMENLM